MDTWILAALLYGALAAACAALFKSFRHNRANATRIVIGTSLIGILAINGIAWLVTDDYETPGISRADIARTMGLEANRSYAALTYNVGLVEPHFTLLGFANTEKGRVLNVDFVTGGTTHPISIPASKVVVQQDRKLPAQMAIVINDDTVRAYGKKRLAAPDPCRLKFAGIVTCQHHPKFVTDPRGDLLLDDVLRGGVERVVIRVSPVDYGRLL